VIHNSTDAMMVTVYKYHDSITSIYAETRIVDISEPGLQS